MGIGTTITGTGYVRVRLPHHSRANMRGYVLAHVLIAEKALGKPLPPAAVVHHHNGDKADNDTPGNLVICQDNGYHMLLERRGRALKACGHASWRKCKYCKRYDAPDKLIIKGHQIFHQNCRNEYQNNRNKKIMLNLPERKCLCGCGEIFKPKRRGQRFKTRACRFKYHNSRRPASPAPEKTCPHCGKAI